MKSHAHFHAHPRTKHYLPLESNPDVFTNLIKALGVSSLRFTDVYSLSEPDLLKMVPRPVLGLVLVFPTNDAYQQWVAEKEAERKDYVGKGDAEDVVWFKQTIGNACGLYAILHALCNGTAQGLLPPNSTIAALKSTIVPLGPVDRAIALEQSKELEEAHKTAANQGDSAVPASATDEVDYHYICFVPSDKTRHVFELDGSKRGPVDTGVVLGEGEDVLSEQSLALVREYIEREKGGDIHFSLMALVAD